MKHPILSIQGLSVAFCSEQGNIQAVKNISFTVNKGEIVALVGESGSGKSVTSLSILQLLQSPPASYLSGQILFTDNGYDHVDLLRQDNSSLCKLRGNRIAMIFQEPMSSLNPVLTCGNQVMEALLTHRKLSKKQAKQTTLAWFKKVKLPEPLTIFNRYPHQLSGGQKQRVMIAMAMCCEPGLLICDEPTTALDVSVQKSILQLIKELQQQTGMAVIFITHDLGVVSEIADRALVMYKGEIVEQNTVHEIFTNPRHPYTRGLLACRPVLHEKGKRLPIVSDFFELNQDSEIQKTPTIIMQKEMEKPIKEFRNQASALFTVHNLSVWFPLKKTWTGYPLSFNKAVNDVSFEIFKGETLGLVGESGCGKTTLGRALLRLVKPTAGKIIYNDIDLACKKNKELQSLRNDIQIIFQDPYSSLNPRIMIGPAIAEPLKVHHLVQGEKNRKEKVIELLEKVDLKAEHFNRYPHEFSGGQRQRIVIARALIVNPAFIVCDESVSALDVSVQAQVLNLLNDLKKELGFTVVFISHDLSVVKYISDRIMVMNQGKIVETGSAEEIYNQPKSLYTQNLIAAIPGRTPA